MNLDEFRQSFQCHNAGTYWNSNNADKCSRHFQGMVIYGDTYSFGSQFQGIY